jgi:drug/metabolite transporter (DMT)-like permease
VITSTAKNLSERSVLLVFCCTLIGAAAQVFFKIGADALVHPSLLLVLTNFPLLFGFSLYGINTLLLVLALRKGQLSLLYPIIALTYVWVTILSVMIFKENLNALKTLGLTIVVAGVAVLGKDGSV